MDSFRSGFAPAILAAVVVFSFLASLSGPARAAGNNAQASDGLGTTITVPAPLQRMISLSPALTDIVFAIGAERALVGAIGYDEHPPGPQGIISVGSVAGLDYERILKLKPQLVLAWHGGTPRRWISKLRKLGLPVFVSRTEQLTHISETVTALGKLTGNDASKLADRFDARLNELRQTYAGKPVVRVFYQVWANPLMTLNRQHIIADAIRTCGGQSIFADRRTLVTSVTRESVVEANPQAIIAAMPDANSKPDAEKLAELKQWHKFSTIDAVKNKRLFVLDANVISRPNLQMLDAVASLCQHIDGARAN